MEPVDRVVSKFPIDLKSRRKPDCSKAGQEASSRLRSPHAVAVPWPYPKTGVRDYFEQSVFPRQAKDRWLWGIFPKSEPGEVIGCVDLWRPGTPENRGFWWARRHWGKGLMTEAVEPVTRFALDELGFDKLVFTNAVGNTP